MSNETKKTLREIDYVLTRYMVNVFVFTLPEGVAYGIHPKDGRLYIGATDELLRQGIIEPQDAADDAQDCKWRLKDKCSHDWPGVTMGEAEDECSHVPIRPKPGGGTLGPPEPDIADTPPDCEQSPWPGGGVWPGDSWPSGCGVAGVESRDSRYDDRNAADNVLDAELDADHWEDPVDM